MERIQKAIEKAREQRDLITQQGSTAAVSDRYGVTTSVRERWNDVTEFEPDSKWLARNNISTEKRSDISVPLDMLRTKILQVMRQNNWNRLAITSPNSGAGKTTISANLAFSLARQTEQRVCLIEMDMKRPNIATVLGMKEHTPQFSYVLEGKASHKNHLLRIGDNLLVGANTGPVKRSSELLQGEAVGDILTDIEHAYDATIMIFDMPPMLVTDDMMAFGPHCDCALLVAAAESTTVDEIDVCERELAESTNILGVTLNKCRYMPRELGYSYY